MSLLAVGPQLLWFICITMQNSRVMQNGCLDDATLFIKTELLQSHSLTLLQRRGISCTEMETMWSFSEKEHMVSVFVNKKGPRGFAEV